MMGEIKSLVQTCGACPSQWEGELGDGSDLFVHYRYGYLRVTINGKRVFGKDVGDSLSGVMSTKEMLRITGLGMARYGQA